MGLPAFYDPNSPQEQPVALPSAPIQKISGRLSIQPPLSRRGHGPGILIFLSPVESAPRNPKPLDPEPVQKWAEEGFTVAFTRLDSGSKESIPQIVAEVEQTFSQLKDIVDVKDKYAIIVYDEDCLEAVSRAVANNARFVCILAHSATVPKECQTELGQKPTLLHVPDSEKQTIVNEATEKYTYPVASSSFVLPTSAEYETSAAALAHTRSLVFLRKHLGGPHFDIEAIWDEHCYFEFEARSVAKTMATMVAEPYVNHVPTMTGGVGRENLTKFYRDHFIFSNPADARLQVISRTVGPDRVVGEVVERPIRSPLTIVGPALDEFIYHITHDRTVDWLLPRVPATGRVLAIPMMAVVNVRGDRLYNEHIWWDQATALLQAGLLPTHVSYPTPEGTRSLRLPVAGVETANMLADETQGKSNEMLGEGWGLLPEQA